MIAAAGLLILGLPAGCGSQENKTKNAAPVIAPGPADTTAAQAAAPEKVPEAAPVPAPPAAVKPAVPEKKSDAGGVAVEVDGAKMTKAELNAELQKKLGMVKGQIPADKLDSRQGGNPQGACR